MSPVDSLCVTSSSSSDDSKAKVVEAEAAGVVAAMTGRACVWSLGSKVSACERMALVGATRDERVEEMVEEALAGVAGVVTIETELAGGATTGGVVFDRGRCATPVSGVESSVVRIRARLGLRPPGDPPCDAGGDGPSELLFSCSGWVADKVALRPRLAGGGEAPVTVAAKRAFLLPARERVAAGASFSLCSRSLSFCFSASRFSFSVLIRCSRSRSFLLRLNSRAMLVSYVTSPSYTNLITLPSSLLLVHTLTTLPSFNETTPAELSQRVRRELLEERERQEELTQLGQVLHTPLLPFFFS